MKVHIRKKKLAGGGHALLLDYFHKGERIREYLKIHILPRDPSAKDKNYLAEKIRAQRELELANENLGFIPSHRKHLDFFVFFQKFIDNTTRKDPRMFVATLNHLKEFSRRSVLPASEIDEKFCRDFRNHLAKHLNGETPFNYFGAFRRVITEAMREKVFHVNPCFGVSNKKPGGKLLGKEVLSDEELKLLFKTECGNPEIKRAFLFCCYTGLRAVDVRALTWKNIDLRNGKFRFSQSKTEVRMYPPLNKTALSLLGEEGKPGEKVFNLFVGSTYYGDAMNKTLKSWVNKAGIKKHITFHCARHTFGTALIDHGTDLKTASELLGHTTTRETEKYLHVNSRMKRRAVDSLPELS